MPPQYTLFATPIGTCGIAWHEKGIEQVQLPGGKLPGKKSPPPVWLRKIIRKIRLHLEGTAQNFSDVNLNFQSLPPFYRRTLTGARLIPAGQTLTYGALAKKIGAPKAARAVGQALAKNPFPILIPCHRILAAGGRLGGFSADGGIRIKTKLLAIEGVCVV